MSSPRPTRPSLLWRIRRTDDERAWREFDDAYGELIVHYCRRCGLQLADAEDVRQAVLLKLSRSLPSFEYDAKRGRFRDYLRRCVQNAVATFVARHKPAGAMVSLDENSLAAESDDGLSRLWEEEWVQHHYRRALRGLRAATDRKTVAVFEDLLRGADYAETAQRHQTTEANVRKIKQRLRERLEQAIRRQLADEEDERDPPS